VRHHDPPRPWSVVAANLAQHATNPIHTDAGATAAGFPGALVAGVTTYAYLCHPVLATWGMEWLAHGHAEVHLQAPVFAGARLDCVPQGSGDEMVVEALMVGHDQPRAVLRARRRAEPQRIEIPTGTPLASSVVTLDGPYGADYARQAGDDAPWCEDAGVVHPAVWPALANLVVHREVARGAWIHTASRVTHHGLAPVGATARVDAHIVDMVVRLRTRARLAVTVTIDAGLVATIDHEAIVDLGPARPLAPDGASPASSS